MELEGGKACCDILSFDYGTTLVFMSSSSYDHLHMIKPVNNSSVFEGQAHGAPTLAEELSAADGCGAERGSFLFFGGWLLLVTHVYPGSTNWTQRIIEKEEKKNRR